MPDSRRQTILEAIRTRLQGIHVDDGFHTDAGDTVLLGELPSLGPDDPDQAVVVVPGDDAVQQQGKGLLIELPIEVHILAKADLDEPWVAVEQMLADVKKAIEVDDALLQRNSKNSLTRGTTRTLERASGSLAVGAVITYGYSYSELWGAP